MVHPCLVSAFSAISAVNFCLSAVFSAGSAVRSVRAAVWRRVGVISEIAGEMGNRAAGAALDVVDWVFRGAAVAWSAAGGLVFGRMGAMRANMMNRGVAMVAAAAGVAIALVGPGAVASAVGSVTVISASVDAVANGSVGRQGSSTGPLVDDPPQLDGNAAVLTANGGTLAISASVGGGPVGPGEIITLPGTTAVFTALGDASLEVLAGPSGMLIAQRATTSNSFAFMDGGVGTAGGTANARIRFSVSAPTTYTLSGFANFDDEDVSGSVRLNTALGIAIRSVFVPQNGEFSFTGTLNAGTYSFNSNCSVLAIMGGSGVGTFGSFAESGSYIATLTLGTPPCDDIDFNNNGVFPEDQDVVDFFDVVAGGTCVACNDIDFNNNGVFPEDQDVIDFFNVLAGGSCP